MIRSAEVVDRGHAMEEHGCHVYGVVRADMDAAEDLVGLEGAPVRLVVHGPIAAVVSDVPLERPPGRRADLLAYSRVLDAAARLGPVVPVQFGSVLEDEQDVVDQLLAPDVSYFEALLDELTGRAQFQVRATYQAGVVLPEVVAADPRIARLRELTRDQPEERVYGDLVRLGELVSRAVESKKEFDAQVLLDVVLPFAAAHRVRLGASEDELAEITVLVDDEVRGAFEEELEGLAEAVHERIRLRLVGPLPPYDFVGGDQWG